MTQIIPHVTFTSEKSPEIDDRKQLATQALNVLGYRKLAMTLTIPDTLLYTLRRLDIPPLVRAKVEEYKRKKAKSGMWSGHKEGLVLASMVILFGCIVAPLLNHYTNWQHFSAFAVGVILSCMVAGVLTICTFITFLDEDSRGHRLTREWRTASLTEVDVPDFILRKAVNIKEALPVAILLAECLYEREERVERRNRDPFLVAQLGDERYYIDVWEEEEFEATL